MQQSKLLFGVLTKGIWYPVNSVNKFVIVLGNCSRPTQCNAYTSETTKSSKAVFQSRSRTEVKIKRVRLRLLYNACS